MKRSRMQRSWRNETGMHHRPETIDEYRHRCLMVIPLSNALCVQCDLPNRFLRRRDVTAVPPPMDGWFDWCRLVEL